MKDIKNHRKNTLRKVIRDARRHPDVAQYLDNNRESKRKRKTKSAKERTPSFSKGATS